MLKRKQYEVHKNMCVFVDNLFPLSQSKETLELNKFSGSRNSDEVHRNTWKNLSMSVSRSVSLLPCLFSPVKWKPKEAPSSDR